MAALADLRLATAGEDPKLYPSAPEPLEEAAAAEPQDAALALAFAVSRLATADDRRPLVLVTTGTWRRERGGFFAQGLGGLGGSSARLIRVDVAHEAEGLWALEEALKSGAVAGGLATAERPAFVTTRRLEFAARAGRACGVILRVGPAADLSAARRRWRIAARPSAPTLFDPVAPGAARLHAELTRRRDGPPGAWELELDDETGGFAVVAGLADHRLAAAASPSGGKAAGQIALKPAFDRSAA
jgi:protein ImuA